MISSDKAGVQFPDSESSYPFADFCRWHRHGDQCCMDLAFPHFSYWLFEVGTTREPFCCLVTTRTKVRSLAQPCDYGSLRFGMDPLVILCEHRFCSFSGSSCWKRTPTLQQPTHQLPRPGSLFFQRWICRRLHHKHRLCPTQPYMYSTHVPQG